jgi:predicted Zn-dependent protease
MASRLLRLARTLVAFVALAAIAAEPVLAQSILRDAETEAYFNDISAPLIRASDLDPANVKIVLINDPEINAFVAGGQVVYINAGLLEAADNSNELQGVIAHELGHIEGGHVLRNGEGAKPATAIMILSLLLGAAAMAAGAADAGMGALMAGQQAAMGKFLAFSRAQEGSADASAVRHLNGAHVSGRGMVTFFGKLKREEYRLSPSYADVDPYAQTHPMSADRQQTLEGVLEKSPWWNAKTPPELDERFRRIKAKLAGYVQDPEMTFRQYPESDRSLPAHYARAYAWHKKAYPDKANAEVDALVSAEPHDPYFLEVKGQILLEGGKPKDAVPPLREAVARSGNNPLIGSLLGQALISTENPADYAEAKKVLKLSIARDNENPQAWYGLGLIYDHEGDQPRAALATAERYAMMDSQRQALASAEVAMKGLAVGTPDYLRAEDIAMAARSAVADKKRR